MRNIWLLVVCPIWWIRTKQTTRTETEPQKWRSHGGLSVEVEENGGKGTGSKKHKW